MRLPNSGDKVFDVSISLVGRPQPAGVLANGAAGLTVLLRSLFVGCCVVSGGLPLGAEEPPPSEPAAGTVEFYNQQIQPLLLEACYGCHSHESGEAEGLLMVDSAAALLAGGTHGPAIVPGDAAASWLYRALVYDRSDLQMPPDRKLPEEQIALIKRWIDAGAVAPASEWDAEYAERVQGGLAAADHWSYQPPLRATGRDLAGGTQAIDEILRRRLLENGLDFSAPTDRRTLLRRLHHDLTGLTPSFEELESFVADQRPDEIAIAAVVDDLLASPHFGERWARHWMDIARYADTKGYVFQEDREYPEAFRYRDWLVQAFNRDLPYAEFVRAQLAADLLPDGGDDLPALGFLTLGRRFLNNKQDIIDDRLDVITRGLMGMTLACARCHDHKYDPVSQADYYALYGVFLNTDEPGGEPFAHRLADAEKPREARILIRGNPGNPGDVVPRRFVTFLAPEQTPFGDGSGRAELAERIMDAANPLTARVLVNRVWMHLMGDSLTESPSDLGTRCPPPTQQDLLDHMAVDFVEDSGSIKGLIRRIVLSQAYSQSSVAEGSGVSADPANRLYWRMNRRRRDLESLRDRLLVASGELDRSLGGPALRIDREPFPPRRTIYAYLDRQNLPGFFRNFDMASPDAHSPGRPKTSVPQQGLYLLNSDFVAQQAAALGRQTRAVADRDGNDAAITWLTRQVLARDPDPTERPLMTEFLAAPIDPQVISERWICGYGKFDPEAGQLTAFERLPSYVDGRWHGVGGMPDEKLGWAMLSAPGGHPGNDLNHAVVRRWIAPEDGRIRISGTLKHPSGEGDGVRSSLLLNKGSADVADAADAEGATSENADVSELLGQWVATNSEVKTDAGGIDVRAGQSLDFVTDCRSGPSHDSFTWTVRIRYEGSPRRVDESEKQLPTPNPEPLDVWALLAQALLAGNEFAFVD